MNPRTEPESEKKKKIINCVLDICAVLTRLVQEKSKHSRWQIRAMRLPHRVEFQNKLFQRHKYVRMLKKAKIFLSPMQSDVKSFGLKEKLNKNWNIDWVASCAVLSASIYPGQPFIRYVNQFRYLFSK